MRRSEQWEHDISLEIKLNQILWEKKIFSNGENMIFPFKQNQSKDCPKRRSSMRTWKSGSDKIIIKIAREEVALKWREHDVPFKQNGNKNCMRRSSCMNLCKNKMIPKFFTIKLCSFNTVENDHQTITFWYLCFILRTISIEDKAQRSKILSLRVAPPINL